MVPIYKISAASIILHLISLKLGSEKVGRYKIPHKLVRYTLDIFVQIRFQSK